MLDNVIINLNVLIREWYEKGIEFVLFLVIKI